MLRIEEQQLASFRDEGYMILESVIDPCTLDMLRAELERLMAQVDAEMEAKGIESEGLNHRGKRYFIAGRYAQSERLPGFLFSDLTAAICRATLGPDAWFFLEQFVVKTAEVGMKFSWHQDSGYLKQVVPAYTKPYLTLWCALDDMSERNGTIWLLPYSQARTRQIVDHVRDPQTNDLVGYTGDEPGIPVLVPAGSIAIFETTVFHRSGANQTDRPRRSYVVQYSAPPILLPDGKPWVFDEPFLADGVRVR